MNTIYYANPKTQKRSAVKVYSGMDIDLDKNRNAEGKLSRKTQRRLTMAESDKAMLDQGFVRWPRNKPLPNALKKAA